jgi:hypothetical protein
MSETAPIPKVCKACKSPFMAKYQWGMKQHQSFCSRTCYDAYRGSDECMLERFWGNLVKGDGCWEYQTLNVEGYGIIAQGFGRRRKQYLAHRFAWKVYHGTLPPEDRAVCHHCDNPRCVRKEHLFLGTWDDNNQDKTKKRRHAHGETNSHAKLTEEQVQAIRAEYWYRDGRSNARELAAKYRVGVMTIGAIIAGRTWRHLPHTPIRPRSMCSAAEEKS